MRTNRQILALLLTAIAVASCGEPLSPVGEPSFARGGGNPAARVETVEVVPAAAEIVAGATIQLIAIGRDRKGNVVEGVTFEWGSGDPAIATVDATGLVTGISAGGPVAITASTGGKRPKVGTSQITVVQQFALDFNDAWVTVPDHPDLDFAATWTIEAWIKPDNVSSGSFQHIVSKWDGSPDASYTLEIGTSSHLRSGVNSVGATQVVESSVALVSNVWQHVAVVFNNGTLSLYINGLLDIAVAGIGTPMNSTRPLSFGREGEPYGGWRYAGIIDEVRVWNVARSASEIAGNRSVRLTGTESGLVGYWRFDEGNGDVALDATGRGHNGQLGNAVGADPNDPTWTTNHALIP